MNKHSARTLGQRLQGVWGTLSRPACGRSPPCCGACARCQRGRCGGDCCFGSSVAALGGRRDCELPGRRSMGCEDAHRPGCEPGSLHADRAHHDRCTAEACGYWRTRVHAAHTAGRAPRLRAARPDGRGDDRRRWGHSPRDPRQVPDAQDACRVPRPDLRVLGEVAQGRADDRCPRSVRERLRHTAARIVHAAHWLRDNHRRCLLRRNTGRRRARSSNGSSSCTRTPQAILPTMARIRSPPGVGARPVRVRCRS